MITEKEQKQAADKNGFSSFHYGQKGIGQQCGDDTLKKVYFDLSNVSHMGILKLVFS